MGRVLDLGETLNLLSCARFSFETLHAKMRADFTEPETMILLARGQGHIALMPPWPGADLTQAARITIPVDIAALPGQALMIRLTPVCEHVRVVALDAHGFTIEALHDWTGQWLIFGKPLQLPHG